MTSWLSGMMIGASAVYVCEVFSWPVGLLAGWLWWKVLRSQQP